jgi:3-oxo-4-pregnene-20-carboxyl-CoA dehydrogenase alpha subunit
MSEMSGIVLDLSEDAKEYGRQALRAFEAAGGDQLVQQAEVKPEARESLAEPVLNGLGAWELDPRSDTDGLEAAAALCRSAGHWALPYPVAERLAAPTDLDVDGLVVVPGNRPAAALAGLENRWAAVTLAGTRSAVTGLGSAGPAFVTELELTALDGDAAAGAADVALALVLPCWTLLGMLDRALELTIAHVSLRKQFGQPLSAFQGVQFQLTDAEVERSGVDILAKYALWAIATGRPEALDDALALRMAALEAADVVFRVCHQLHGAVGFCDETTLSWLSRYSQPLRRLPYGLSATRDHLTRTVGTRGLTGLYT